MRIFQRRQDRRDEIPHASFYHPAQTNGRSQRCNQSSIVCPGSQVPKLSSQATASNSSHILISRSGIEAAFPGRSCEKQEIVQFTYRGSPVPSYRGKDLHKIEFCGHPLCSPELVGLGGAGFMTMTRCPLYSSPLLGGCISASIQPFLRHFTFATPFDHARLDCAVSYFGFLSLSSEVASPSFTCIDPSCICLFIYSKLNLSFTQECSIWPITGVAILVPPDGHVISRPNILPLSN